MTASVWWYKGSYAVPDNVKRRDDPLVKVVQRKADLTGRVATVTNGADLRVVASASPGDGPAPTWQEAIAAIPQATSQAQPTIPQ